MRAWGVQVQSQERGRHGASYGAEWANTGLLVGVLTRAALYSEHNQGYLSTHNYIHTRGSIAAHHKTGPTVDMRSFSALGRQKGISQQEFRGCVCFGALIK